MTRSIFLIGGGKGGVGKSLLSMTVVDFLELHRLCTVLGRDGHLRS